MCSSAMCQALAELVRRLSPTVTQRDIDELPLLTLGGQLQGSNNNKIGQQATLDVFLAIKEIVQKHIQKEDARRILIINASGRRVRIIQAADPDVRIEEELEGEYRPRTAIEIKGGADKSNAHDRTGEAEKKSESPTTSSWFDVAQVLGRTGASWHDFGSSLAGDVGIPFERP